MCGADVSVRLQSLSWPAAMNGALVPTGADIDLAPVLDRRVTVLGSTGSVGTATLDVVRFARTHYGSDSFPLEAITAQKNVNLLAAQAREFRPRTAVIGEASLRMALTDALFGTGIEVLAGKDAILEAASHPSDMVMSAIVGTAGPAPPPADPPTRASFSPANKQ